MQLQIAAKPSVLCCHLANTNEELRGLATEIPLFAKLLLSLLLLFWFLLFVVYTVSVWTRAWLGRLLY